MRFAAEFRTILDVENQFGFGLAKREKMEKLSTVAHKETILCRCLGNNKNSKKKKQRKFLRVIGALKFICRSFCSAREKNQTLRVFYINVCVCLYTRCQSNRKFSSLIGCCWCFDKNNWIDKKNNRLKNNNIRFFSI